MWRRKGEECSLEELVNTTIPVKKRDPLVTGRSLPRFGLRSFQSVQRKPSILDPKSCDSFSTTNATLLLQQAEDQFSAYQKAAKRNRTLKNLSAKYELNLSPLRTSLYTKSNYPAVELTPELRVRRGAALAFRMLHKMQRNCKSANGLKRPRNLLIELANAGNATNRSRKSVLRQTLATQSTDKSRWKRTEKLSLCTAGKLTETHPKDKTVFQIIGNRPLKTIEIPHHEPDSSHYSFVPPLEISETDSPYQLISPAALSPKYHHTNLL